MSTRPLQRLLVGVSASIGVLSVHSYLQVLLAEVADEVRVIMTPRAARMVNPDVLAAFTRSPVLVEHADSLEAFPVAHVNLPQWAQAFVILPASADLIGRAANGIADDLLTSTILAAPPPVVFCPNMNPAMWSNPAVQRNVELLRGYGHTVVEPTGLGYQVSTGRWVRGGTPQPSEVAAILKEFVETHDLAAS